MRVLIAHNAYQQRGGEDAVVDDEIALLRSDGHTVLEYRRHNDEISTLGRLSLAAQTLWSRRTIQALGDLLRRHRVDVVHAHNTFPLISPSLHHACRRAGVPVVQTLHNFRLLCPAATFVRDGALCEDCVGRPPWPAVQHGCYRGSRVQTAVVAATTTLHHWRGTWQRDVARYIVLSEFNRRKFIEAGWPAEKLVVKPNFVAASTFNSSERSGFLYVGRLSPEKGVDTLGQAMAQLAQHASGVSLQVAGDGPARPALTGLDNTRLLGSVAQPAVMPLMATAQAVVVPSICYEAPRTLIEAFATGTPVIASRIGAMADWVQHGETGLLFPPGDASELARTLQWAADNPRLMQQMGARARTAYEAHFTPERNLQALLALYETARQDRTRPSVRPPSAARIG